MKRAFPQKVKPVPSCVNEDTVVGQSKQASSEGNRRGRTSAAMIGLAISMGAHSMLIAHQSDEAMAAEPLPSEPAVTTAPSSDVAVLSSGAEETSSAAALAPTGATVIEYTVQEGQTLWQLAQFYGVNAATVAALNKVPLNSVLHVGQVLKIPVTNRVAGLETNQGSIGSNPGVNISGARGSSPVGISNRADDQDVALKAEQDAALGRLRQKREDLKLSLTKLKAAKQDLQSVAEPPTLQEHKTAAYEASSVSTYKVAPGDTLIAIAQVYGISPAKLAAANQLNNPNVIRVNQVLVIPQAEAATQAKGLGVDTKSQVGTTVAMLPTSVASDVPVITADTKPDSVLVPIRQTGQTEFKGKLASLPSQESSAEDLKAEDSSSTTVVAESPKRDETAVATAPFAGSPSFQGEESIPRSHYSYVENLKQEILKLREKYQTSGTLAQSGSESGTKFAAASSVFSSTDVPVKEGSQNESVNPEFSSRGYTESLRTQIQRLQAKARTRSIEVSASSSDLAPVTSKSQSQLVATAPIGSQNYEPLVPSSLGQMVTPNLPPLGGVENYLPGNSGKFNGYIWPAKGLLTSGFGWRWGRMHKGIDIAAPIGTPVVAAAPGVVVTAGWNSGGYGNLVEIKHADGSVTLYAHNNRVLVREGQQVEQGQQIAEMGSTGYSTGPHCHFEVHPPGQGAVNPIAYLPRVG